MWCSLVLVCVSLWCAQPVRGHGRVLAPPSRASAWRFGFPTPPDYDDDGANCGGYAVQHSTNGGKCGICGDAYNLSPPRPHELGGQYGVGVIVARYRAGGELATTVDLTTSHRGYWQFKLCPDPTSTDQACFDNYVLRTEDGDTKYYPTRGSAKYEVTYRLPAGLECEHCVLQWRYTAGNNWGICANGSAGLGCGPQEQFGACSDITLTSSSSHDVRSNDLPSPLITYLKSGYFDAQQGTEVMGDEVPAPPGEGHLQVEGLEVPVVEEVDNDLQSKLTDDSILHLLRGSEPPKKVQQRPAPTQQRQPPPAPTQQRQPPPTPTQQRQPPPPVQTSQRLVDNSHQQNGHQQTYQKQRLVQSQASPPNRDQLKQKANYHPDHLQLYQVERQHHAPAGYKPRAEDPTAPARPDPGRPRDLPPTSSHSASRPRDPPATSSHSTSRPRDPPATSSHSASRGRDPPPTLSHTTIVGHHTVHTYHPHGPPPKPWKTTKARLKHNKRKHKNKIKTKKRKNKMPFDEYHRIIKVGTW